MQNLQFNARRLDGGSMCSGFNDLDDMSGGVMKWRKTSTWELKDFDAGQKKTLQKIICAVL